MASNEEDRELLNDTLESLLERFDSVQIFVTRHRKGSKNTDYSTIGGGNWFARLGQINEWLVKADAVAAEEVADPDAGAEWKNSVDDDE